MAGYYTTINFARTKRTRDVPVIMAWDNSASCKTKMKWDDDVLYVNGLTCDNSASSIIKRNDKALYNNQLDKALHTFATTATAIITSVGNIGLTPSSFRCQQ